MNKAAQALGRMGKGKPKKKRSTAYNQMLVERVKMMRERKAKKRLATQSASGILPSN